jgi:starvation-inducible DNA-binding protein
MNEENDMSAQETLILRNEELGTPTDLSSNAVRDISAALKAMLADVFALYLKTKNYHWHMSGPHFRDYHLLLDEQADQIFAITDDIASAPAKSAERRCARSARSVVCSVSSITIRTM